MEETNIFLFEWKGLKKGCVCADNEFRTNTNPKKKLENCDEFQKTFGVQCELVEETGKMEFGVWEEERICAKVYQESEFM